MTLSGYGPVDVENVSLFTLACIVAQLEVAALPEAA